MKTHSLSIRNNYLQWIQEHKHHITGDTQLSITWMTGWTCTKLFRHEIKTDPGFTQYTAINKNLLYLIQTGYTLFMKERN